MTQKHIVVRRWLFSNKLQRRKYYLFDELLNQFIEDHHHNEIVMSKKSFAKLLTNIATQNKEFNMVHVKRRLFKYIILSENESGKFNPDITRISPRKNQSILLTPPSSPNQPTYTNLPLLVSPTQEENESNNEPLSTSETISKFTKIDLPVALSFFLGKDRAEEIKKDREESLPKIERLSLSYRAIVLCHLHKQVTKLHKAHFNFDGWKHIVDNPENARLSPKKLHNLRIISLYLSKLYQLSIEYYSSIPDFNNIAKLAILAVNQTYHSSICVLKDHQTLLRWFRSYRDNDCFVHFSSNDSADQLPSFLSSNPDTIDSIQKFCRENIQRLTVELLHSHINETIIPDLVKKIQKERNNGEFNEDDLKREHGLESLTISTVNKWMNKLGFKYGSRKKCYYVDNHDSEENIKYRNAFIDRYFQYELRMHRWYSITETIRDGMISSGELEKESGHAYTLHNIKMYEYHVDDHISFQDACSSIPFGGCLSVRKPPNQKPLIPLGQDEVIFKQFLMTSNAWTLPDGYTELVPKDDGAGVMLSSICSRELGYGCTVSDSTLKLINEKRKGEKYSDEKAAIIKNGTSNKPELKTSPFVRELEYGASHDGYWSYEFMVLQMEDCIDCLTVMFPSYDFLMLFDHSNGHDRLQPNGLNINKINVRHAGKQPTMRDSTLTSDLFGPYHTSSYQLQPGMVQSMQYQETDLGPCYVPPLDRLKNKYDVHIGRTRSRNLVKSELVKNLQDAGIEKPTGCRKSLQEQCLKLGLHIKENQPVVIEGWAAKAKGSLQVLFERGWVDPTCIHLYTSEGKKGDEGNSDPTGCYYSIKEIMKLQKDFIEEVTLLQYHAEKLGILLDRTPKCHPEIAGEGIEYAWGLAKLYYRRSPIRNKRTKEKFRKLVRESTNFLTVLNIQRMRHCSKKARSYMKLYKIIQSEGMNGNPNVNKHSILEDTMKAYLKFKKIGKSHRSVIERQHSDVTSIQDLFPVDGCNRRQDMTDIKVSLVDTLVKRMNSM